MKVTQPAITEDFLASILISRRLAGERKGCLKRQLFLAGTAISVGVFSHILKIDDAIVGIMSSMSKILAGFVYAFATTDWMIYLGKVVADIE